MAGAAVCFAPVYLRLLNGCLGVPCCEIVVLEMSQDHRCHGKWSIVKLPGNIKDGEFSDEQCGLLTKQCTQSVKGLGRDKVVAIIEIVMDRFKLERVFADNRPHSSGALRFDFSKLADKSK